MMTEEQIRAEQTQKLKEQAKQVRAARLGAIQNEIDQLGRARDVIAVFSAKITSAADTYVGELRRFTEGRHISAAQLPFDVSSPAAIAFFFKDHLISRLPKLAPLIVLPQRWDMNPVEIPDTLQGLTERIELRNKQLAEFLNT